MDRGKSGDREAVPAGLQMRGEKSQGLKEGSLIAKMDLIGYDLVQTTYCQVTPR